MTPQDLATLVQLRRARDLIDREYARPLDVPTMAGHALMSPAHFSRRFRAAYGETPYGYLMTRRIERAMALLRGGMSVTDACMAVGCTSLGSFSSRFTELLGETPSAYRARQHGAVTAMPACLAKLCTRPTREPHGKRPHGDEPREAQPYGDERHGDEPRGTPPNGKQANGTQPPGQQPPGRQPAGKSPAGKQPPVPHPSRNGEAVRGAAA